MSIQASSEYHPVDMSTTVQKSAQKNKNKMPMEYFFTCLAVLFSVCGIARNRRKNLLFGSKQTPVTKWCTNQAITHPIIITDFVQPTKLQ